MAPFIFPDGTDRSCPTCKKGTLSLKTGKFGAFLGCSEYPECKHTSQIFKVGDDGEEQQSEFVNQNEPKVLGVHPEAGREVSLKKGPYGFYVELALPEDAGKKDKPKRSSLPRGLKPDDVDLDKAVGLLQLPREVGAHPEDGKMIKAAIGRFGPYLQHDGQFYTLKDDDVLTVGINRAVDVIAVGREKKKNAPPRKTSSKGKSGGKGKATSKKKAS